MAYTNVNKPASAAVAPPKPAAAAGTPYKPKDVSGALPEYDAMRARLTQRANADIGQQQDAMARRFAAQGALNTGSAIKQQQLVAEAGTQKRDEQLNDIAAQEASERRRLQEAESQKEFQSQEALAGRQFQASESQLARESQRGMFDDNLSWQDKWKKIEQSNTMRQLDMAAQEMEFNKMVAFSSLEDDQRERFEAYKNGYNPTAAAEIMKNINKKK